VTEWRFTHPRRLSPGHLSTTDIDQFGRRLRLGEPVDLPDVARMEAACDRIAKRAPLGANVRQTALRVLRLISDWRKARQTTTPAVVDQPHPAAESAAKQKGPNDERT